MPSQMEQFTATLSSTMNSILDTGFNRRHSAALPLATALGAFSLVFFSYLSPTNPRSSENKSLPLVKKAPKPIENDPMYPPDLFDGAQTIDTPLGEIKTFELGPKDGKKLLLVHGISTPSPIWKNVVPQLVAAGHRVLIYDLPGRGYSDSPQVPHDVSLYVSQISLILTAKPDWDRFNICGMSLGGPIVCNFASYFPSRIEKIFLICPAGGTPLSSVPIQTKLFSSFVPLGLMQSLIQFSPVNPVKDSKSIGSWQARNHPGFFYSFLSSISFGPIYGQEKVMSKVCHDFGNRIQTVWGDADDVVPMETKNNFAGNMKVHVIPGGGHWILSTHGDQVAKLLIAHLDS